MGGRGSSSGGGGGGGSQKRISSLENKISGIKTQLYDMVRSNGGAVGLPKKYYKLQQQRQSLESKLRKEYDKSRKQTTTKTSRKPFVNGYGEATKREITSGTYERAQKRIGPMSRFSTS